MKWTSWISGMQIATVGPFEMIAEMTGHFYVRISLDAERGFKLADGRSSEKGLTMTKDAAEDALISKLEDYIKEVKAQRAKEGG